MPIGAGDLDQRVTFQTKVRASDGGGGYTETWGSDVTVWAKVAPVSAAEQLRGGALQDTAMYRITIRNRSDIDGAMRVLWNGEALNIRQMPEPAGGTRAEFREIIAEAGVAQ